MSSIYIKFSGLDENSGVIFLQFATDETLLQIDKSTIHGFFPSQYNTHDVEKLIPLMAEFGHQMLNQQAAINKNKFSQEQVAKFNQLMGTTQVVPINSSLSQITTAQANQYDLESSQNVNGQVDQMRNIVLEILAEEGLILGKVK